MNRIKRSCKQILTPGTNWLLALLTIALALTACSPGEQTPTEYVFDDLGRLVAINGTPQRIISLAPSNTEILFALGLEEELVGVTDFCDYPPEALEKEKVGNYDTPDIEKILVLNPDLILVAYGTTMEVINSMVELGLTVFGIKTTDLDDLLNDIRTIGEITDKEVEAQALTSELETRIEAVTDQTGELEERPSVFYFIWNEPIFTVGSGTFEDVIIEEAGGVNIGHNSSGYFVMSMEDVIARNPEVIVAPTGHAEGSVDLYAWAMNSTALNVTDARQNDRVYEIDEDLIQLPGPRLVDGLEWFAWFIHPEIFEEPEST